MSRPCFFSHSLTALLLSESTRSTSLSAGDFQILKFTNFDRIVLIFSRFFFSHIRPVWIC